MSVTDSPSTKPSHLVRSEGHRLELDEELSTYGAQRLITDTRVAMLLATEARQQAITRVWGVAREDQSRMVTLVLCAAAITVAGDALAKLVPHPKTADVGIGASLVFLGARGLAGIPAGTVPLAGAAIALAVVFRRGNDAMHDLRVAAHDLDVAFRRRYGRLIALEPRRSEPAV